jgi:hypothetical protein
MERELRLKGSAAANENHSTIASGITASTRSKYSSQIALPNRNAERGGACLRMQAKQLVAAVRIIATAGRTARNGA